jgi:hypothetical protein
MLGWLEPEERRQAIIVFVTLALLLLCVAGAQMLLPENCLLYEYRQVGFLCDAFDANKPDPALCPVCRDEATALFARYVFLFGIAIPLIPLMVWWLRRRRRRTT